MKKEILNWLEAFITDKKTKGGWEWNIIKMAQSDLWDIPGFSFRTTTIFCIYKWLIRSNEVSYILFAHYIKIFRTIKYTNGQDILQHDLNILEKWSDKWLLKCHHDKCKKNNVATIEYSILKLYTIEKQKDLGITVDTKLSFVDHITQVVNKATNMTKLIRRTFQFLDKDTFVTLYKTMVRIHLAYVISGICGTLIKKLLQYKTSKEEQPSNYQVWLTYDCRNTKLT